MLFLSQKQIDKKLSIKFYRFPQMQQLLSLKRIILSSPKFTILMCIKVQIKTDFKRFKKLIKLWVIRGIETNMMRLSGLVLANNNFPRSHLMRANLLTVNLIMISNIRNQSSKSTSINNMKNSSTKNHLPIFKI